VKCDSATDTYEFSDGCSARSGCQCSDDACTAYSTSTDCTDQDQEEKDYWLNKARAECCE